MRYGIWILLFCGLWTGRAAAEPWLSTRYAQNCAGCHAPGRKNLEAMDRRCTLSCQGCHVNPNGGGLRSQYGKWNEDRWLRSFKTDALRHKPSTAPTAKQAYGVRPFKGAQDGAEKKGKKRAKAEFKKPGKDGFKLVEVDNVDPPEERYKRDGLEFDKVGSRQEFMYQVPQEDPMRELDRSKTDAGGDVRWQWVKYKNELTAASGATSSDDRWSSFLMDADFAARWRPFYKNLHIVYEARIQGSPTPHVRYEDVLLKASTRSLYVMADNLPFNVFAMGGYYRPLFGNFVPDHYTLAQLMTTYAMSGQNRNYSLLYTAVSAGTAPNVPYLNVHLVTKRMDENDKEDRTKGFAANAGLRFVSFGASMNYSYWRTTDRRSAPMPVTSVEMHSIGVAGRLARTSMSLDAVSVKRDVDTTDFRQGGVVTLDTYTQMWREQYFTLNLGRSNTTTQIKPGNTVQGKAGVRSFWIPGFETMLVYSSTTEKAEDLKAKTATTSKVSGIEGQFHLSF